MSYYPNAPNAPTWPFSGAYYGPAALTGPCLVDLCGPIDPTSSSQTCHPILAQCKAGSTNFTTASTGSQSFGCAYQSQNVTVDAVGDHFIVACGLISLNATIDNPDGLISLSNPGNLATQNVAFSLSMINLGSTFTEDNGTSTFLSVPIWPQSLIDLSNQIPGVYPFIVGSSAVYASSNSTSSSPSSSPSSSSTTTATATPSKTASPSATASAKSSGNKNSKTSSLTVGAGLAVFLALSALL